MGLSSILMHSLTIGTQQWLVSAKNEYNNESDDEREDR